MRVIIASLTSGFIFTFVFIYIDIRANRKATFNNAFNYRYEENSKADIEFKKIIKRLAEIEKRLGNG